MVIFRTLKKQYTAEATWETTVAMAAPAMPQWKPTTKSKSRGHVHQGRHHNGVQGRFGVPQGPQNGRQEVVGHNGRDAPVDNAQVQQRPGQHVLGGVQQAQQGLCPQLAPYPQQHGEHQAQRQPRPPRCGESSR